MPIADSRKMNRIRSSFTLRPMAEQLFPHDSTQTVAERVSPPDFCNNPILFRPPLPIGARQALLALPALCLIFQLSVVNRTSASNLKFIMITEIIFMLTTSRSRAFVAAMPPFLLLISPPIKHLAAIRSRSLSPINPPKIQLLGVGNLPEATRQLPRNKTRLLLTAAPAIIPFRLPRPTETAAIPSLKQTISA